MMQHTSLHPLYCIRLISFITTGKLIPAKKQREMMPVKSIPQEVRKAGIYLQFLQGYNECFGAIKKCLTQKLTPTLEHLKAYYPKDGIAATDFNHFLEKV